MNVNGILIETGLFGRRELLSNKQIKKRGKSSA
jgi:hypothetical protein